VKKSSSYYRFKAPNTGNNAAGVDCVTFMTMESRLRWRESQGFMPQSWEQEADLYGFPAQNETIQLCSSMGQPPDAALMTKEDCNVWSDKTLVSLKDRDPYIDNLLFAAAKVGREQREASDKAREHRRERQRQREVERQVRERFSIQEPEPAKPGYLCKWCGSTNVTEYSNHDLFLFCAACSLYTLFSKNEGLPTNEE